MARLSRRLRELDELLSELPLDGEGMVLGQFDGFVAGLHACPDLIPPSVWLPEVLGADGSAALDGTRSQRLLDLLMQHYNATGTELLQGSYAPVFYVDERHDETLWEPWMEGFDAAMALRPEGWAEFIDADEHTRLALAAMMVLSIAAHPDRKPPLQTVKLGEENRRKLIEMAPEVIPGCVVALSDWTRTRTASETASLPLTLRAAKVGRNEPCTCGSGKKYKKCCALREADALAGFGRSAAA